ncbi:pseudouridine synthase [Comamonas testosteroni]|uniref:pseudouridine synthase n=1 Tax=Comamonas testosteroni TaxID=285 RepID=UPI0026EF7446|nr:pseudouridine synthase [Comamonas testosteroni]WQD42692.1 pseudouridine synthase [Comamonas testosteroni]
MSVKPPKESGTPGAGNSSAPSDSSSARPVLRAPAKPAKAEKPAAARGSRPAGGSDRGPRSEGPRGERGARPQRERDERPRASGFGRPDGGRPARDEGERRGGFSQRDERSPRSDRDDRFAEGGERRFGGGDRGFRPYGESRDGDRSGERREFRPRDDRRDDRPQGGRDFGDHPRSSGFGRPDQGRFERSEGGERREFRPRDDRRDDRPQGGRDFGDRPRSSGFGRPDQGRFERSEGGERREFRPRDDRRDDRPQGGRDFGDRPRSSGFGRPDQGRFERSEGGERREFRPRDDERRGGDRFEGRRDERPQGRDFGDRPQNRGFDRPDRSEGGERREYQPRDGERRGGDRPQGRDFGDRPQNRGYGDRPEGRSFDRGDRRNDERRGERRDDRGGEPEKRHIPGSFVSEATRRPTTGIRTYRPAADGSDRAIPVKRAPEADARQDDRPGAIRINKRIADMGLCSRREADEWVENGWVKVNGEVAIMGQNVVPGDRIEIDQRAQDRQDQQVTILLNKPMGYVSGQAEDGHEPAVVLITNENRWNEDRSKTRFNFSQLKGLAPCGRLDIDSVGLLVLTQDGRVARQIIGEDSEVDKEYLVRVTFGDRDVDVQSVFPEEKLALLRHGLSLDEQPLKPAQVDWQNPEQLRFVLTEGKKRQIRRMCEQVGLKVVGLKRIRIGGVSLGNLPTGQWRYLAAHESF